MDIALFFFLLVGVLGTLMRYYYVNPIYYLDYKHILHAHSHVAMLGWAFMLASGAIIFNFLKGKIDVKKYKLIFVLTVISTVGMLIFFTINGYGVLSIAFSTLHIFTSYIFCYYVFRDLKYLPDSISKKIIQWALFWMILSTMGIWMIGPVSAIAGKSSSYFYMAVQFFLHFQFNGWFTYAAIGIWIYQVEKKHPAFKLSNSTIFLLHLSLLLTYALSITWSNPLSIIFYLNTAGVLLQVVAFFLIFKRIFKYENPFKTLAQWQSWLFALGILCLMVKVLVQAAVAFPFIAEISYTIRNYVIGFIHLIMLGSVTFTLVAIMLNENFLANNKLTRFGWGLFSIAFILKELALFLQGTLLWLKKGFIPHYHEIILVVTALLPIALLSVIIGQIRNTRLQTITLNSKIK